MRQGCHICPHGNVIDTSGAHSLFHRDVLEDVVDKRFLMDVIRAIETNYRGRECPNRERAGLKGCHCETIGIRAYGGTPNDQS